MAHIHLSRLMPALSRISHGFYRGPNHLTSCLSKRYIQEFPERKANNLAPDDYVLILPEPLSEHEGTNELLKITKYHDIDYSKLNTETVFMGLSQALLTFENYLTDTDNRPESELKPPGEFFKDIERQLYPLDSVFNVAIVLMQVDRTKYDYKEFNELINRYYKVRGQRFSGTFKDPIQEFVVNGTYKKLSEPEKKMVRLYYKKNTTGSFIRSLDASTQLPATRKQLAEIVTRFKNNLEQVNREFSHTVDDPDILASISSDFGDNQSLQRNERTPLKITPSTYKNFMRVCPDRFVRQMLWQTYNRRCSSKSSPKHNNIPLIDDIRVFRRKIADLSGYRSHLDYRLSEAMAQSKQQLTDMLSSLNEENTKELYDRVQELTDFATDNSAVGQFIGESGLEEHDIDYWTHRYAHDILIGQSETQLRQYFSLPVVMDGLKGYFKSYFGLDIISRDKKPSYWDRNVQTLDVKRNDKLIGSIVFDPYFRANKSALEPIYARIRCKSMESGLAPVRFISTAFKQDIDSNHAHLSFLDIANLFHSFAIVLQRLLYNYNYYELNAYGGLEADVDQFFPNLCMAHLLTNHKILQSCSRRDGAKPIDSELAARILKGHTYFRCFRTWRELYLAHLDMEAHASLRDINKLVEDIYPIYSPFPRSPDNYDFCSFDGIFAGPHDGAQYSGLWSRQLVNFCLAESQTLPIDNSQQQDVSKTRSFNEKLIDNLFAADNFNTKDRLLSLLGRSFDPAKTSLRIV